jgi:short-subunit dehydrogenase
VQAIQECFYKFNRIKEAIMAVMWIVGASSGIGLHLTERLLQAGYQVVASARNAEESADLSALESQFPGQLACLDVDVSVPESLPDKTAQAWRIFGQVDVWFYNAGTYTPSPWQEAKWSDYLTMTQVNYLGCVALQLAVRDVWLHHDKPPMRWVWNLSIASQVGLPYGGGYSAPKAALFNLAESLQPELQQVGIRLQVVNHGFVKTRLTAKNTFEMPGLMTPEAAAERIADWLASDSHGFELHFPKKLTWVLKLLRCLPSRWVFALTRRMLKHA